jgi:hypothetical protein
VFDNRVPRRIFGLKIGEATGRWRKLHDAELHNLYSSPSIIRMFKSRRVRWARHVARVGEDRIACRIMVEGQKEVDHWDNLHMWVDNSRMDLGKIGWSGVE